MEYHTILPLPRGNPPPSVIGFNRKHEVPLADGQSDALAAFWPCSRMTEKERSTAEM